jgi:hypothetical protein
MLISIISIVLLAGLAIGSLFWHITKNKQEKSRRRFLATAYEQLLREHRLNASAYEIITQGFIALDEHQKKLVVMAWHDGKIQQHCICLRNISESRVEEEKESNGNIKKITLQLHHCSGDIIYEAPFFDISHDRIVELPAMAKKAMRWKYRCDIHRCSSHRFSS